MVVTTLLTCKGDKHGNGEGQDYGSITFRPRLSKNGDLTACKFANQAAGGRGCARVKSPSRFSLQVDQRDWSPP